MNNIINNNRKKRYDIKKNFFSISYHLKYGFLIWVLLSLLLMGIILIYLSFRTNLSHLEIIQYERSRVAASKIESYMDDLQKEISYLSKVKGMMVLSASILKDFLEGLSRQDSAYEAVGVFDNYGKLIFDISFYSSRVRENNIFFESVANVLNKKKDFISNVEIDNITKIPSIILAVPLRNEADIIFGVLSVKVNLKFLWLIVSQIDVGKTGYAYIVDKRDLIIAYKGEDYSNFVMKDISEFEFFKELPLAKKKFAVYKGLRGKKNLGAWCDVNNVNWKVIFELPTKEAYAPTIRMIWIMFDSLIFFSSVVLVWGFLLSRRILKPLNDLTKASEKICSGDFYVHVKTKSRSELGVMAATFNEMASRLRELVLKLQYRIEFETLIASISADYIHVGLVQMDKWLKRSLAKIGSFVGVDRVYAVLFSEEGEQMEHFYEWCDDEVPSQIQSIKNISLSELPWFNQKIKALETIYIPKISELPKEANREKNIWLIRNIKSLLRVPIVYGTSAVGFLGFDSVKSEKFWAEEDIAMLRITGEMIANILERKKAEKERYLLAFAVDQAAESIIISDKKGSIIYVNPAFEKIMGYNRKEVIGKNFRIFKSDRHDEAFFKNMWTTIVSGESWQGHIINRKKDNTFCEFETTISPIRDDFGNIRHFISLNRDVTQETILEKRLRQAEKMQAIGTLAGGIAHDFNNLLMGIQGNISLLLDEMSSDHVFFEKLKHIEEYVQSGSSLTRHILGFARGGKYEQSAANLNEIIRKNSELFGRTRKEVNIHLDLHEKLSTVELDKNQIEQVLLNLYLNAWQAMPDGGDMYIKTSNIIIDDDYLKPADIKPGEYVKISVRDSGIGMDKSTIERIFEPFFTTREIGRGTGLGLASAYGIIKNHNGFINVYSELGKGSIFDIYLPASEKTANIEIKAKVVKVKGNETVLLVDDEEMIINVGKQMLIRLGYKVLTAKSGKEGVEIFKQNKNLIDLVVLDMIMHGMSGSQVFDALKDIKPDVKVLLSSGYSIDDQGREIIEKGCKGFIQKPFTINEFSQKIRDILEKGR